MTNEHQNGFWRLEHKHLAAFLALSLQKEAAQVYLALADLTYGHGKDRDVITLQQICDLAHIHRRHTSRALAILKKRGLYGQTSEGPRRVNRWVVWPPTPEVLDDSTPSGTSTRSGTHDSTRRGTVSGTPSGTPQEGRRRKKPLQGKKTPPDPRVKEFIDWFCQRYQETIGRKYIVSGAKDGKLVKTLLGKLSSDELKQATVNMFSDSWAQDKASIGLLSSQINKWLAMETPEKRAERQFLSGFPPMKIPTAEEAEALLA